MTIRNMLILGIFLVPLTAAGCSDNPAAVEEAPVLLSVAPTGGATGVDPSTPITLQFSHGMQMDMEMFVAVHEGTGVAGPLVDGTWEWSVARMHLTFTPSMPLDAQVQYTIHVGGGMMDADGHVVDLEMHGHDMGGNTVTQQMMDDRMMQGGGMMGGNMGGDMMGPGWQHPDGGTYGMIFSFTTA
jgi:hypothetical protein